MKTIRNNLWMMMIAWIMVAEKREILGLVIAILASICIIPNLKKPNKICLGKASVLVLLLFSVNMALLNMTYLKTSLPLVIFVFVECIDFVQLYQYQAKTKLKYLYIILTFSVISYLVMFGIIYFIPSIILDIHSKISSFSLITVVFIPYSSMLLYQIIKKEYRIKKTREYLKTLKNKSMFNIKA